MPASVHLFSRGPADQVSGGYLYNAQLAAQLEALGHAVDYHADGGRLAQVAANDIIIVDGLVLAELAVPLSRHPAPIVTLLHMRPDRFSAPDTASTAALQRSRIVVTGESVRDAVLSDAAISNRDVTCIPPGIADGWQRKRCYANTARQLLCIANYVPGKGHLRLIETLAELSDLDWTLKIYGNTSFASEVYRAVRQAVAQYGLSSRIEALAEIPHPQVNEAMCRADLLLQFSTDESYSMVTAEALSSGLPVVSHPTGAMRAFARHGTIAHVDTQDRACVAARLRELLSDPVRYAALCHGPQLPQRGWREVAREFVDVMADWL